MPKTQDVVSAFHVAAGGEKKKEPFGELSVVSPCPMRFMEHDRRKRITMTINLNKKLVTAVVGALLAATMVLGASAQRDGPELKKPRLIGLQLYSVRDDCAKDLPGVLKAVAKMGYTGVEFAGYYGRRAKELRQMLDEDGLKCYGTHIPPDTLLGDNLAKTIEFNQILGNKMLVVPWIPTERRNTKEKIIETAKLFSEIAAKLKPSGMTLGYHNHMDEFKPVGGEVPFDTFFSHTDKSVAIQFDTGNVVLPRFYQLEVKWLSRLPAVVDYVAPPLCQRAIRVIRCPGVALWFLEGGRAWLADPPPLYCPAIARIGRHGSSASR